MKKLSLLISILILISFLFLNCRKSEKSPVEGAKKVEEKGGKTETENELLTESEVKSFIKAFPVFKEIAEKAGKKFEGADKNVLKAVMAGKQSVKYVKKLNRALKPYGFDVESFMTTYMKITSAFPYLMMGGINKSYDSRIKQMKEALKTPNLPEETRKELKESIKQMEEERNSEEIKIQEKNVKILEKYKDQLEKLMEE